MTVAKARRQLTKQINHDVSIYPLRRPHRDGTHFLPPNTPKDTPTGSIQIIYALRLFQKSLVRNMKLVPGYPRWWLILHRKWGRRRGYEREGGWNNTTILAWGIEGNNATLSYEAMAVLWVILGCTAVCFHVVCYWQSCARSCERRIYIHKNTRPGGGSKWVLWSILNSQPVDELVHVLGDEFEVIIHNKTV